MSDLPGQWQSLGCDGGHGGTCALGVWHHCSHGDLALICSPYTGTGGEHMGLVIRL